MFIRPFLCHSLTIVGTCLVSLSPGTGTHALHAAPFFEDGFLGLTKQELHEKLGTPHAIRSRKAALRVFSYYSSEDWDKYFGKLVSR